MGLSNNPYLNYRRNQVETAAPEELLLMLYRGAFSFIHRAREALAAGNLQETNRFLGRAQDILCELLGSLNPDLPELSGNLFRLYEYIHYLLVQANLSKEAGPLDEAEKLLGVLQEAWQDALAAPLAGNGHR